MALSITYALYPIGRLGNMMLELQVASYTHSTKVLSKRSGLVFIANCKAVLGMPSKRGSLLVPILPHISHSSFLVILLSTDVMMRKQNRNQIYPLSIKFMTSQPNSYFPTKFLFFAMRFIFLPIKFVLFPIKFVFFQGK